MFTEDQAERPCTKAGEKGTLDGGGLHQWFETHHLFCIYETNIYEVAGASRLGDVWLREAVLKPANHGYDIRVDVTKCLMWWMEDK